MLEARVGNWFGRDYTITYNQRPFGSFRSKGFSETLVIHLLGRHDLELRKPSMFQSRFLLIDTANDTVLAEASKASLFSQKWKVQLSIGEALLVPTWAFSHKVFLSGTLIGTTRKHWLFSRWKVEVQRELPVLDQLMLGLIYQIVIDRNQNSSS